MELKKHMRPNELIDGLTEVAKLIGKDATMVEIGSFAGESTAIFADNVKYIFAIDPWENGPEDLKDYDMNEIKKEFFERMKDKKNCSAVITTSELASEQFKDESLDAIYIDGSHKYEDVKKDLILWIPKVKKGGIISGHDYIMHEVNKAVNEVVGMKNIFAVFTDSSWVAYKQ